MRKTHSAPAGTQPTELNPLPDGYRWSNAEETDEDEAAFIVHVESGDRFADTIEDLHAKLSVAMGEPSVADAADLTKIEPPPSGAVIATITPSDTDLRIIEAADDIGAYAQEIVAGLRDMAGNATDLDMKIQLSAWADRFEAKGLAFGGVITGF